jgi:tetratricopeptide (TPR) repeat protein
MQLRFERSVLLAQPKSLVLASLKLVTISRMQKARLILTTSAGVSRLTIAQFGPGTAVPTDADELNERIALLSALLQARGAKGLEYHLARCLVRRNRPGDLGRALPHARRATGPQSRNDAWVLRLHLEEREFGPEQAMKVVREALASIPVEQTQPVYQAAGEILVRAGKPGEAVELLRQGIKEVRPEHNLYSLYQAASQILAQDGKPGEALDFLLEGASRIPDARGGYRLKDNAIHLAVAENRLEVLPIAEFEPRQAQLLAITSALARDDPERAAQLGAKALRALASPS